MKYTQVAENAFEQIQLNAGILVKSFTPTTGTVSRSDIIGATSGGVNFTATPEYIDFGEDIDNVPNNTKELKRLDFYEVTMSGDFVTADSTMVKMLVGAADVSGNKITPRADLADEDFTELWWVGDYSDKNGTKNGGFIAIHMLNALNTGGFQIQSSDKGKGTFSFEFSAHYSLTDPETVPFEVYVKAGTAETSSGGGSS